MTVDSSDAQYSLVDATATKAAGPQYHLLAILLALLGGGLGVIGAFVQEFRAGGGLVLFFLGAPIIEEGLKPVGVYILLVRWPQALRGQLYTAALAALSGLCFGAIESLVYVALYVPDHSDWFVAYRFTVPLFLHATASFLVGLGINRRALAWAQGEGPLPKASRNLYLTAVTLHALFNIVAAALSISGVLNAE